MKNSHNGFTRRRLLGVACFAVAFVLLFLVADALLHQEREYSGTWTRIRSTGGVPEVLIMGNSHAFCSFVPKIITEALGLDTAVLGASGINSVGITDSFEAVLSVGAPKYLVLEANAYTFDYDATALYHKAEALSNINGMPGFFNRVKSAWREFGYESIPQGAFQLLRADLMWKRWKGGESVSAADGSGLLNWHATGVFDAGKMQAEAREYTLNRQPSLYSDPRNDKQLRRVMRMAQENGVKVLLVKAPTEHQTQLGADMLMHLETLCQEYGDTFLGLYDFHNDLADMGLEVRDFYDNSHLNRSGAAKLTAAFVRWMGEKTGREVSLANAFAYAGEKVEQASETQWRYVMNAYGTDVEYRFLLDGEEIQGWSKSNALETAVSPWEAGRIECVMRQGDEEIQLAFMTPNTCIFN